MPHMPLPSANKAEPTGSKTGVSVASQMEMGPTNFFLKKEV